MLRLLGPFVEKVVKQWGQNDFRVRTLPGNQGVLVAEGVAVVSNQRETLPGDVARPGDVSRAVASAIL